MNGYLLIDKDQDWTSHDVVAKLRGVLRSANEGQKVKIGHTGTLDPMATGLLILMVGQATKRAEEFSKLDKVYEVEITLGGTSNTDDAQGVIVESGIENQESENRVKEFLEEFIGEQMQTPPVFSAIKVNGQRAYKAARKGNDVELEPRKIVIHSIEDIEIEWPKVSFNVHVSSGTYIRSIARDLGEKLGCGGYLSALRRTQVGKYSVQNAYAISELNKENIKNFIKPLD